MIDNIDLSQRINTILDDIRYVFSNPTYDTNLTVLVAVMLLVVLALLFALGYLAYSFATRKRLRLRLEVPVSESPYAAWGQRLFIVVAVALTVVALSSYTAGPSFCANCHAKSTAVKALQASAHKDIDCLECHQSAGISGVLLQKVDYSRWLWVYATTNKVEPATAPIADGACLRCHSDVRSKTVSRYSIKMRHSDVIQNGARCVDCHNSVAHPGAVKPVREPSMSNCIRCHNAKKASAECATCHEEDVGTTIREPKRDRIKAGIFVNWDFCYRCHEQKPCTQCHGVQMPHPPDWVAKAKHARPAFTNRKVCWRCHDIPSAPLQPAMLQACSCHGSMEYHGTQEFWRTNHGPIALGREPGDGENDYCYDCHSVKLCDYCHREGRYKARTGPALDIE